MAPGWDRRGPSGAGWVGRGPSGAGWVGRGPSGPNVVPDRQTDTQTKYCNPRCACAPRVNNKAIPATMSLVDRVTSEAFCVLLCFTCLSSSFNAV